jgi:UDP-N-acetylglucosamine acyltransferase
VAPGAIVEAEVKIGPYCIVGPQVRVGRRSVLESHVVLDGETTLGSDNHIFPFASVGLVPQDLKFRGEPSRVEIGDRNVIRESVTIHRGTAGGGGLTKIGSDNLVMTGAHIAHDCQVGSHIILANAATLAGHVEVADWATIGAFSGVHQFCRVGQHAFVGGYTVVTKDVLPYSKTVGNRACIYGVNSLGLQRRGFGPEAMAAIRRCYRTLLQSRLNTSDALAQIEAEVLTDEVRHIAQFIRGSARGVILKRPQPHAVSDEE